MGNGSFLNISNDFTTFIVKRDYDRTAQGDSNASYLNYSKATFVTIDDLAFNLYREGGTYPNKNKFIVKSTGGAYTLDYVTITNIDPDTVSITGYRRSGIYTELYKNSNQPAASDTGTTGTIADSDPYVLQVGDANTHLKADIAEVIVFDKALTAAEYAIVNAYLAQKVEFDQYG